MHEFDPISSFGCLKQRGIKEQPILMAALIFGGKCEANTWLEVIFN
jgi:hypothetical protein